MKCAQYTDWLQLSVDRRLDADRQHTMDAHLAACAACQHDYALLEEVRDALAMPAVAEIDLTAAIRGRIAQYEITAAARRERLRVLRRDVLRRGAVVVVLLDAGHRILAARSLAFGDRFCAADMAATADAAAVSWPLFHRLGALGRGGAGGAGCDCLAAAHRGSDQLAARTGRAIATNLVATRPSHPIQMGGIRGPAIL